MASSVRICNLALGRLGAARITSLTDNTAEAKLCNLFYEEIVEEVLVEGAWATAIRRADLNATSNTPEWEYSYEFQLPTNPKCLKVLTINDLAAGEREYVIEGDKLLINDSDVEITYIAKLTDSEGFGPSLKRCIVNRLAAELAFPITGSAQVAKEMYDLYEQELAKHLAIDGQQGSGERTESRDLHEVRS